MKLYPILLASMTLGVFSQGTQAGWLPMKCINTCTADACLSERVKDLCKANCQNTPSVLKECEEGAKGTSVAATVPQPSSVQIIKPTPSIPSHKSSKDLPPRTASQSMAGNISQLAESDQQGAKTEKLNMGIELVGEADTPPTPPTAPTLSPETEAFFKTFSNDYLSAARTLKCLTKTITVDKSYFARNPLSMIKKKFKADPYKGLDYKPYNSYEEYERDMGQYFDSMVSLNINEAFQQWGKHAMKAQNEFQGLITRGIRFAEGVAKKLPGYSPSSTQTGSDMLIPYLHALPNTVLTQLETCIQNNDEETKNEALKSFYGYFLKKINIEKDKRKSSVNDTKIAKSVKKLAKK